MSCCPDGAWNNLNNKEYKPKGTIDRVDATEIDVYRVENSKKCLIWNYTIFRFDGGRVKQMADFFADHGTSLYGLIYSHTYLYKVLSSTGIWSNICFSSYYKPFRIYGFCS